MDIVLFATNLMPWKIVTNFKFEKWKIFECKKNNANWQIYIDSYV